MNFIKIFNEYLAYVIGFRYIYQIELFIYRKVLNGISPDAVFLKNCNMARKPLKATMYRILMLQLATNEMIVKESSG